MSKRQRPQWHFEAEKLFAIGRTIHEIGAAFGKPAHHIRYAVDEEYRQNQNEMTKERQRRLRRRLNEELGPISGVRDEALMSAARSFAKGEINRRAFLLRVDASHKRRHLAALMEDSP